MTMFIEEDDGTGTFLPGEATTDLLRIANLDSGYGEDLPIGGLIQVTYARTDSAIPPVRLDELVNTAAPLPTGGIDVVVQAVDDSFVLPWGDLITTAAGVAFQLGAADNPRPASSVVIYDTSECAGSGYWVDREGGGTTSFPRPAILYHELSHSHDFINASSVGTQSSTEPDAEADENDMRDLLGVDHRDPTSHVGGCGGGPEVCCIVASIATGSPYSREVGRLRQVRDRYLRRSQVGHHFFTELYHDYYAFSPVVCRLMAEHPTTLRLVADHMVGPLVLFLDLVDLRASGQPTDADLGEAFLASLRASWLGSDPVEGPLQLPLEGGDSDRIHLAQAILADLGHLSAGHPAIRGVELRWALLEPVDAILTLLAGWRGAPEPRALGAALHAAVDAWAGRLPVTAVWTTLLPAERAAELRFVCQSLTLRPEQADALADRVAARCGAVSP